MPDILVGSRRVDHVWLPEPGSPPVPSGSTQQHRMCRLVEGDGAPADCRYFVGGVWDHQTRIIRPGQQRGEPTTISPWSDPKVDYLPELPVTSGVLALIGALLLLGALRAMR